MAGVSIDTSEVFAFAAELGRIPGRVVPDVDKVMKKAAQNLKDDYNEQAAASTHFKGMAGSVTYDRASGIGQVGYEVGPDKGRRGGALGNIFFFGGSNGGGGTGDLDGPIRGEGDRTVGELGKVVEGWF